MRFNFFPVCLLTVAALTTSSVRAFEYTVEMPEVLREGSTAEARIHLLVKVDDPVVIAGVLPPQMDSLEITPGSVLLERREGEMVRWTYTFIVTGKEAGKVSPDPFTVQYFETASPEPDREPMEKELQTPALIIKPPHLWKRQGAVGYAVDLLLILVIVVGGIILWKRRKKR